MFSLDEMLNASVALGKQLGRRPYKELRNILVTKPHRFVPPNVPELRIPGDPAAVELIDTALARLDAEFPEDGLRALRATIERPTLRAAGEPSKSGERDYFLGAIVELSDATRRLFLVTVRTSKVSGETNLQSFEYRSLDAADESSLRKLLVDVYSKSTSRKKLIRKERRNVAWLRGNGASGVPEDWARQLEGTAATYGLRLSVLVEPEVNPKVAGTDISSMKPLACLIWDHDGRGSELQGRIGAAISASGAVLIHGTWPDVLEPARAAFAQLAEQPRPSRPDPASVAEVVTQFQPHADLVLLPAAHRSAKASVFRRPSDVRDALEELSAAVEAGAHHAPGGLAASFSDSSFQYAAGISETARKKFSDHYTRDYEGRKILLEPHLRLGAGSPEHCLRIYWCVDKETGKVVVGHVGEHLPDAGSP